MLYKLSSGGFELTTPCINLRAEIKKWLYLTISAIPKNGNNRIVAMKHLPYTLKTFFSLFVLGALLTGMPTLSAQDLASGESLFKANCSACHKPKGVLIGPALGGAAAKYANDKEWLYKWVKNSPALIAAGDEKAVALWEQYNKVAMQAFPNLSDEDIDNILAYAEAEATGPPPPPPGGPTEVAGVDGSITPQVYYTLLGLVALLALIAVVLVFITATLISAVRAKEGKAPFTFSDVVARTKNILQNKFVAGMLTLIVLTAGGAIHITEARKVSLHKGYMPAQPIKFSHKLHAGQNQINCEYCHSGVRKSKSAWIPSANVCMNCHKVIQEGPTYGTEEIAKIYEAVGYDPATGQYTGEEKPIEWIRIHNLPDHAYFNHSQHVVVGNLECQTCHGPIEEMEVVYQYSTLGMGWCINCHREEKVKVMGEPTEYTVEDMGGLNCGRCHY